MSIHRHIGPNRFLRMQFVVGTFLLAVLAFEAVTANAAARCRIKRRIIARQQRDIASKQRDIARNKEQVLARLRELGAFIAFDYQWAKPGTWLPNAKPPGDPRLQKLWGKHYAANPVEIQLFVGQFMKPEEFTDDDAKRVASFAKVKWLVLMDTKLTDVGLMHLVKIRDLERLDVEGTQITDEGVKKFKALRPKVRLFYEP